MATLEERMQALEQEHTALKKTIELQTIAIGALVNKATLEKLNEKYDKLFEAIINHNRFTDEQLAEIRNQNTELDGKIVGLQTETRHRLAQIEAAQEKRVDQLNTKMDTMQATLAQILTRLSEKR